MARAKADDLGELVERLWEQLDRLCPRHVVELALSYAGRRGVVTRLGKVVVVHRDPHPGNALRAAAGRSPSGHGVERLPVAD